MIGDEKLSTPYYLKVLYISTFLLRFAFGAILLVAAWYVPAVKDNNLLGVAIFAVPYPLAEMCTANLFGIVSDKIGRKKVIIFGTGLASLIVITYTFSNNVWYLSITHGIHGIGAAATVAPAVAMIADLAHYKDRGRQMGLYDYATFSGYILGPVLGGILYDRLEASLGSNLLAAKITLLVIAGILAASALMLHFYVLEEKRSTQLKKHRLIDFDSLKASFRIKEIKQLFPIWLIIATLLSIAITYLPRILQNRGLSGTTIGLLFGGAGLALGLLQPFWGKVSDRVGRLPVMYYGVLSIFGIVVILAFFMDAIANKNPFVLAILGLCGLGAGAFVPAALAMMADRTPKEGYGATMGLYSFALGFGAFIAETVGLAIIYMAGEDKAVKGLLYFAAILIGLAVILMLRFIISELKAKRMKNQIEGKTFQK